jgi:putative heme-binding domain-containing protein
LWSLQGLDVLTRDDLAVALADADAHVREHAVQLAEPLLSKAPDLLETVLNLVTDDAPRVRFQAALTLGEVDDERVPAALAVIARHDSADPWMRAAVLSSLSNSALPFLLDVLADDEFSGGAGGRAMIDQLCEMIGTSHRRSEIDQVLNAVVDRGPQLQQLVIRGVGAGLKRGNSHLGIVADDPGTPAGRLVAAALDEAQTTALNADATITDRQQAVQLLAYGPFELAQKTLPALLDPQQSAELQRAAVLTLTSFPRTEVADIVLSHYDELTPEVRGDSVTRLLTRTDWLVSVLDAISDGVVSPGYISWTRRDIYMKSSSPAIRDRATALFAADAPSPRAEVLADYQSALSLPADVDRGRNVYLRECRTCHRLGDEGHDVGPGLATIRHRTPAELLLNILDPNREVSPNFLEYVVLTGDGLVNTGIIASETATSITLRQAEGKEQTILRTDIEEIRSSQKSLMPEGLEKKLTPQEVADVISFLLRLED